MAKRPRVLVLDCQDSFTYNLVQALQVQGAEVSVRPAQGQGPSAWAALYPSHVLVSPGPGRPEDARGAVRAIRYFAGRLPLLGVCLGHQALAVAFGAKVVRSPRPMHGKTSAIHHLGQGVFKGLPQGFRATRYHSLTVQLEGLPQSFRPMAWASSGELMGLSHASGAQGVQFHPESILTPCGTHLLSNFLRSR